MIHSLKNTILFAISCLLVPFLFILPQRAECQTKSADSIINIVFTSDAHYGITRKKFRGDTIVPGYKVNAAMVGQIKMLPENLIPKDGGVNSGKEVGGIDYLVEGGDIANRMEIPIQNAATSWGQFADTYINNLHLTAHNGGSTKLLIIPGNHDISNTVGFAKPMNPLVDPSSMVQIYNLMLKPKVLMTNEKYDYATDKINYSFNTKGIHFMFITLWPDSLERIWMQKDLETVSPNMPVIIFTHDEPTSESKHFTNPLPPHNMTIENGFQNLLEERYKEGNVAGKGKDATDIEQRGFVKFLKLHPNIKVYFHGNSNWNEFYTYNGPDNDVALNVFRVDSPMKGDYSSKDETLLSFHYIAINTNDLTLTVRECLWNTNPSDPNQKIVFGKTATVSLKVGK